MFNRLQRRSEEKARASVEGTLARSLQHDLTPLRILEVTHSERKGSRATVVAEDGGTFEAWFWWYQATRGEMVICRRDTDVAADPGGIAAVFFGNRRRRGVIDRVPRDVMERYLRDQSM
jgi:hypothetical protein